MIACERCGCNQFIELNRWHANGAQAAWADGVGDGTNFLTIMCRACRLQYELIDGKWIRCPDQQQWSVP